MDAQTEKDLSQRAQNWELAVNLANKWRKTLKVPSVNYPYPGDPDASTRSQQ